MMKRVAAIILAVVMAMSALMMCACDEKVFEQYKSDTFELGENK